jgi:uncharacterized protein YggE
MFSKAFVILVLSPTIFFAEEVGPKLNAGGSGKVTLDATWTVVRLGVEIEKNDSETLEGDLSRSLAELVDSIKGEGVAKVETTNYQIVPEYSPNTEKRTIKGYRGLGEVSFKTTRELAAKIISKAMRSGSNRLNGVEFKASDEALQKGRLQAIQMASKQAMDNAKAALEALGLTLNDIKTVDVQVNPSYPRPLRNELVSFAAKNSQLQLEGTEEVDAQVNLSVSFTPKNQ